MMLSKILLSNNVIRNLRVIKTSTNSNGLVIHHKNLFLNSNLLFILMSYAHFFRILVYRFSYVKSNISFNIDMITSIILISQQTNYIVFNILHNIEMFRRTMYIITKSFFFSKEKNV